MPAISSIAMIASLGAGLGLQAAGMIQQADASQEASEASKRAETARQKQLELESSRKKREIIRQGILAKAQATSTATAQGAQFGSTLPGAAGSIASHSAYGVGGVNESQFLGNQIFQANRDIADAQSDAATGAGLSSLGGALTKNLGIIGRLSYGL